DVQLYSRLQSLPLRTAPRPSPSTTIPSATISTSDNVSARLDDINAALASAAEEDLPSNEPIENPQPIAQPDHYWTGRLLAAGFTIDECQQIRALPRETILQHASLSRDQTASSPGYTRQPS